MKCLLLLLLLAFGLVACATRGSEPSEVYVAPPPQPPFEAPTSQGPGFDPNPIRGMLYLPKSSSTVAPVPAPTILVSTGEIRLEGGDTLLHLEDRRVPAEVRNGLMIVPLFAALEPLSAAEKQRVRVEIHQSLSFSVLREVLYTAGQAGFGAFDLAVEGPSGPAIVHTELPDPTPPMNIGLSVEIGYEGYIVHYPDAASRVLPCANIPCGEPFDYFTEGVA